jgi:hypothetical protein
VVRLANLNSSSSGADPSADSTTDLETTIDLFDPPVHIQHMPACLELKQAEPELTLKQIGKRLNIGHMTVKRAFDYSRLMERLGTSDPFRVLTSKPDRASRWKPRQKLPVPDPAPAPVPADGVNPNDMTHREPRGSNDGQNLKPEPQMNRDQQDAA